MTGLCSRFLLLVHSLFYLLIVLQFVNDSHNRGDKYPITQLRSEERASNIAKIFITMALKSLNTIIVSPMVVVVKPFLENKEKIMVKSERLFFSL